MLKFKKNTNFLPLKLLILGNIIQKKDEINKKCKVTCFFVKKTIHSILLIFRALEDAVEMVSRQFTIFEECLKLFESNNVLLFCRL